MKFLEFLEAVTEENYRVVAYLKIDGEDTELVHDIEASSEASAKAIVRAQITDEYPDGDWRIAYARVDEASNDFETRYDPMDVGDRYWYDVANNRYYTIGPEDVEHLPYAINHPQLFHLTPEEVKAISSDPDHSGGPGFDDSDPAASILKDLELVSDKGFVRARSTSNNDGWQSALLLQAKKPIWVQKAALAFNSQVGESFTDLYVDFGFSSFHEEDAIHLRGARLEFFLRTGRVPSKMVQESSIGGESESFWYDLKKDELIEVPYQRHDWYVERYPERFGIDWQEFRAASGWEKRSELVMKNGFVRCVVVSDRVFNINGITGRDIVKAIHALINKYGEPRQVYVDIGLTYNSVRLVGNRLHMFLKTGTIPSDMVKEDKEKKGTFVGVRFSKDTVANILQWMKENKIDKPVDEEELHTTLVYSKDKEIPWDDDRFDPPLHIDPHTYEFAKFGPDKDVLVLKFERPELTDIHEKSRYKYDLDWDFDEYEPHVTFSYDGDNSLKGLELPGFPLIIEREYHRVFEAAAPVGQRITDPEFRRWFAGSKVVDKNRQPLVVYRGDRPNKTSFGVDDHKGSVLKGNFFFTDKPTIGRFYSPHRTNYMLDPEGMTETDGLYRVYLSLKNPLIFNAKGESWSHLPIPPRLRKKMGWPGGVTARIDYIAVAAREFGYDGMIVRDVLDQAGDGDQFVAFSPSQIRFATSRQNIGITESITPHPNEPGMNESSTPEFQRWFKDSKVVDATGKPLLLYHGTTHLDKILGSGFKKGWTQLSDAKTVADSYQQWDRGGSPGTLAVYVNAKNPAYFDGGGQKYTDIGNKVFRATWDAEKAGHDAMIIRNIRDHYDSSVPIEPHTTVVAFQPEQIRSFDKRIVEADEATPAKKFIARMYRENPNARDEFGFVYGEGEDQQIALFNLKPTMNPSLVEIAFFHTYPQRSGVGTKAMRQLQALAAEAGVRLMLRLWANGKVSPAGLRRFYKRVGFTPVTKGKTNKAYGGQTMIWPAAKPVSENVMETVRSDQKFTVVLRYKQPKPYPDFEQSLQVTARNEKEAIRLAKKHIANTYPWKMILKSAYAFIPVKSDNEAS